MSGHHGSPLFESTVVENQGGAMRRKMEGKREPPRPIGKEQGVVAFSKIKSGLFRLPKVKGESE